MERLLLELFRRRPSKTERVRFDRHTERARRVLGFAQEKAINFGSASIRGNHFVLGLLQEEDCLGVKVLRNLLEENFDPFVQTVSERLAGAKELPQPTPTGIVGLSEEAKDIISLTESEARGLKHHYVGTEHQLLGILRWSEQNSTLPVFEQFGITHEKATAEIKRILTQSTPSHQERMRQIQEKPIERFLSFARSMDRWGTDIGVEGLSIVDSETQQQLPVRQIKVLSVVVEIDGQPQDLPFNRIQSLIVENPNPPQAPQ